MSRVKGLLIDLDGVIYNDSQLIPGASETIQWLQEQGIPFRFITNTTMRNRNSICAKLAKMGIKVESDVIFSAVYAASLFVRQKESVCCHLLLTDDAKEEFAGIKTENEKPDYVVAGDLGQAITFEKLNTAFQKLFAGAELIALQKNRFWLSDRGYTLDAGAFVALLEFASDKTATIIGKPSRQFFELAMKNLELKPSEILMIGDDIDSDIGGASKIGIPACLVQTGKYRESDLDKSPIKPDIIIPSIANLKELLNS